TRFSGVVKEGISSLSFNVSSLQTSRMPPKAAVKRKGKDGEGTSAVKTRPSDGNIDDEEEMQGILGLPKEILHKIYAALDMVTRVNLSLTCKRLYEMEKTSPAATSPQIWSHMAIRINVVEVDSGQRSSRRLNKQASQMKMIVEMEIRNGDCKTHDDVHPECKVTKDVKFGKTMKPRKGEVVYWKVSLAEAPVLLQSIFLSSKLLYVCANVDMGDWTQEWFQKLSRLECDVMSIYHVKDVCDIDREEKEEPALLSPSLFA
ncbi:hypothetical protein PENTCL1PPCAC_2825, partial [Pristionchus entomophagus]